MYTYRTGRTLGRTVYRQLGDEPSKQDAFVGIMETPELAALVVYCFNIYYTNLPTLTESTMPEVFRKYNEQQLPFES